MNYPIRLEWSNRTF